MYPFNHKMGAKIQTDAKGISVDRGFLAHLQILAAAAVAASNTAVHAAMILADGVESWMAIGITSPDVPRAIRIKGNAAGIVGDVTIEGTNYLDEVITEVIAANGANAVDGNKAFKTVTRIGIPARNAGGDTISIGFNDKLGLPYKLAHNTVIATYVDNALEGTAATVTTSLTAIESNTIDPNTALSGKVVDVYLIV